MSIPKNILDNKEFKDFMDEAKAKIPALSVEWTDFNITDPGITILEILAWSQDINIYKLSKITEKHLYKYLNLLNTTPEPANPSSTMITIKSDKFLTIPENTEIKCISSGKFVSFITTQETKIQNSEIKKLIFNNERGLNEYSLNKSSSLPEYFYLFGEETKRNNLFYIGFNKPLKDTFSIGIELYEEDLPEKSFHNKEKINFIPDVEIEWSYWDGKNWETLEIIKDNTNKFYKSGTVILSLEKKIEMKLKKIPVNSKEQFYFLKCKLKKPDYEISPRVKAIFINAVNVIQKEKHENENLGKSNGFPNQIFFLKNTPVTSDEVVIKVNGEIWKETKDLKHHSHKEKVFYINRNTGEIQFGDNINGKVPSPYSEITATYFSTLGEEGNINEGSLWKSDIDNIKISNPFPAKKGKNPETLKEAFLKVKKDLKIPYQCVTAEDFEYIALNTPDLRVARAKAYQVDNKNLVNVIVVPFSFKRKPYPSKNFIKTVCIHIEKHRLITTDVNVLPPEYAEISTSANIKVKEDFNTETVLNTAYENLEKFFNPVFGWKNGKGWKFGYPVYLSDIYEILENTEGIECVFNLQVSSKGAFLRYEKGNIILKPYALTVSGKHNLTVIPSSEECRSSQ